MSIENPLAETKSLCPECLKIIPAVVFYRDGKVWIAKECDKHGKFEDLYWGDYEMYMRAKRFARDGNGISNPNVKKENPVCPKDCGLCGMHKSHTALANIALTTRCDRNCWYCFFFAERLGYIYEPTMGQIREMLSKLRNEKPVPCNAIQLSLDASERIFLRNPEGLVFPERLGNFVDKIMKEQEPKNLYQPIKHEKVNLDAGWEVLTIDKEKKSVFIPVKSVIRHKNSQELFKIETDCGWNISTTGSHSVFVMKGSKIVPKNVRDIKIGDVLLGSMDFPINNNLEKINLLDLIESKESNILEKIVVCGFSDDELKRFEKLEGRRINWESVKYSTYKKSGKKYGSKIRYFNSSKGKELPIKLKITPELCRLLGYYVGEGCTYKGGVIFSFSIKENELLEDFEHCVKSVFGATNIRKRVNHDTSVQVFIEGYLYKIFFNLLGAGRRAKEKRVPWIIFNLKEDMQKEFLKAYFKCDGNVKIRKSGFEIDHNTVSRELAQDLIWLHLKFGVTPKVEISVSKPHLVEKTGQFISKSSRKFRVVINGKEDLKKSLWYLDGDIKKRFKEYSSSKEKHSPSYLRLPANESIIPLSENRVQDKRIAYLLKRIKYDKSVSKTNLEEITDFFNKNNIDFDRNLNDLSHSSLGFFKVRKIRRIKPSSEYVYDISVPGSEAFFAGFGPLLAHNTGGEPTMREDLIDIIKLCKEEGFDHVQLNTNGIRISQNPDFTKRIRESGVNTLYLSFDGLTPETNIKNHWEIPGVMENCRKAGIGIVLVPTVIRNVNDHEIGDIIKFGFKNIDVIRSVNYQPVSLVGMMPRKEREKHRITIPDTIKAIEEQTDGQINSNDFYPVPSMMAITNFVEALTKKAEYSLSTHFACGMGTYVFEIDRKMVPITRFIDVEGLLEYLDTLGNEIKAGKRNKYVTATRLLFKLNSFIDKEKAPKGFSLGKILWNALIKHDYKALGAFHHKSLFIGMMHFQDLYNYDIERVKRCCIHYAMTDGRIIPFCAFNVIPEWYRDKTQKSQGIPIKEWEKETGKKIKDDLYKRDTKKLEASELYRETYDGFLKRRKPSKKIRVKKAVTRKKK